MLKKLILLPMIILCGFLTFSIDKGVESIAYPELNADVFKPADMKGKLPTVFFAHNGYGKKEDWGNFPKEVAAEGYITVSIGWEDMSAVTDIYKSIDGILKKYESSIDMTRVAFIGGCHGAVKLLTLLDDKDLMAKINVKTAVAISVSEDDPNMIKATKNTDIPILAIYAKRDVYGYSPINKKFAEELLREPKKVIALDVIPHGNEMLVKDDTKPAVSKEIKEWLKKYL